MLPLLTALQERGLAAIPTGPSTAALVVPFAYQEISADLDAVLEIADGEVGLDLIVPVLSLSVERLAAALPNEPTRALFDPENDELHLASHVGAEPDADLIVGFLIERACAALCILLDAGIVDVIDASDDEVIASALTALEGLKERSPREAVVAARAAADRSRSLGNPSLASFLELAAAEVLIELGDIHRAVELVDPAWEQLDKPIYWREVVTVVAQLRARQGDLAVAVALLEGALAQQDDEFDAAVIRGDLGVLLAQSGRRVEASHLLAAAVDDEHLDDVHRDHFRTQLDLLRGRPSTAATASANSVDVTNARLNELAAILLQEDRRMLAASRSRLRELIAEVSIEISRLGPSQQVRFSMAQGCLAVLDDRLEAANMHLDRAVDLADQSGDKELARWVRGQAVSLLHPTETSADEASSTPMEVLAVLLNRALAELPGSIVRAQASVRQAIELADVERHRYSSVADRAAWTALVSRIYEVGLASSLAAGDHAEVIEILERARAQGAPTGETQERHGSVPPAEDSDQEALSAHLLRLTRESLGDRPVGRPLIASIRSDGQMASGSVLRVDLDSVIEGVAGGPAWWWTCHSFGERIYWALRSPDGETWAGAATLPGGPDAIADLAEAFRSVESPKDLRSHPLVEDQAHRLDAILAEVAKHLLPRPLVDALADAAGRDEPLRLVWAVPHALARIPVCILPIGEDRVVLDGAAVVLAPPTSLVVAAPHRDLESQEPRDALLILGGDADLGMLRDFAEAIAPQGAVLGAARHVKAGVAASLASPQAVLEALRTSPTTIGVYYGHIDDDGPFSYSVALSLTDGLRRATLEASEMLTEARGGAPHVMILAGCSSLSATHLGTGEWWGLATAFLWQGARHVIGSTWDLLPTATTHAFVAEMTSALRAHDDPIVVLRDVQRRFHERWRTTGDPCPYEWAGWSIVSAGAGAARHRYFALES